MTTKLTHVTINSGNNEWYTPTKFIEAARDVLGSIDLDPASSHKANETVRAKRYYTISDNGLAKEWHGKVWMNPPYGRGFITDFCSKMHKEVQEKRVTEAIVLVNNATETKWFRELSSISQAICFPEKRIRFLDEQGNVANAPIQGQAFIYFGDNVCKFYEVFSTIGLIFKTLNQEEKS